MELWKGLPSDLFTKRMQVLVVASAGNSNKNYCATYYGGSGVRVGVRVGVGVDPTARVRG